MKKIVVLFVISLFIISCVSGPPSYIDSIDKLVKNWAYGLEEKDIDTLMDTYWPEAVFTFIPPEGDAPRKFLYRQRGRRLTKKSQGRAAYP